MHAGDGTSSPPPAFYRRTSHQTAMFRPVAFRSASPRHGDCSFAYLCRGAGRCKSVEIWRVVPCVPVQAEKHNTPPSAAASPVAFLAPRAARTPTAHRQQMPSRCPHCCPSSFIRCPHPTGPPTSRWRRNFGPRLCVMVPDASAGSPCRPAGQENSSRRHRPQDPQNHA